MGGILGGLAHALFLYLSGKVGLTQFLGVDIAPHLSWNWLQPKLLWGGIWGALFALCGIMVRRKLVRAALIFSLIPSAFHLFYVYPQLTRYGYLGIGLGLLTPLVVICANAVYGVVMAAWVKESLRHQ